ncbi:DUF2510 domain-containing protein [Streptomyces sp. N2-109]|uniref:DUF2510 domain-containing protein n=1 Tax=Streptomyces gossypii TaxID=2883101 RepID=A0ABT2JLD1_9ACTN|nr:DUF2510 domain-containing protein [Streptomyces gossypii]MCT2588688.1 DUF2510 domain-containing protein [Streptomyces gossypii]
MTTPPGWFPDPGHTGNGPALERWWDGSAWTEQTRAPGYPQMPMATPPGVPPGQRPKGPLIAGICASVAVVVALIIGSVLVLADDSGDDSKDDKAKDKPSPTGPDKPGESGEPDDPDDVPEEPAPSGEPGSIAEGVKLPLLGGWQRTEGTGGAAVTIGPYKCPGDKEQGCVRGGAAVMNASAGEEDAETLAKADIEPNAQQSYGAEVYGGIESHKELLSEKVSVAGEDGYRVRWQLENKLGPDAYIESVVFPHPDGSGRMLVIRSGFDIHDEAPPLSAMDKLVKGVTEGTVADDDGSSEQV